MHHRLKANAVVAKKPMRNCSRTAGPIGNFLSGPWSAGDDRSRQRGGPEEQTDNRHSATALPRDLPGEQSESWGRPGLDCRVSGAFRLSPQLSYLRADHREVLESSRLIRDLAIRWSLRIRTRIAPLGFFPLFLFFFFSFFSSSSSSSSSSRKTSRVKWRSLSKVRIP